jgi:hypothetical protein
VRDLVLGMTVALSDGTIAKSGGTVIKNVAGYDLAKLFAGSFGTLGAILKVAFRLHPLVRAPVTIAATGDDPSDVADCALDFVGLALEAECLDLSWDSGGGGVFVRLAGAAASMRPSPTIVRCGSDGGRINGPTMQPCAGCPSCPRASLVCLRLRSVSTRVCRAASLTAPISYVWTAMMMPWSPRSRKRAPRPTGASFSMRPMRCARRWVSGETSTSGRSA